MDFTIQIQILYEAIDVSLHESISFTHCSTAIGKKSKMYPLAL